MIRIPKDRVPTHPGEVLLEDFLTPMEISQRELADSIHVPFQRVNEIINGRRGITPATALRLARFFGTSADFWLNLQLRWDLYHAQQREAVILAEIKQFAPQPQSDSPRNMALVYRKMRIDEQGSDFAYWQSRPPRERLETLEQIREEYHLWKYGQEPRLQRVYSIVKR